MRRNRKTLENPGHMNVKTLIFIISIVIAVFFTIQALGKRIYLPFPSKLTIDAPSVSTLDEGTCSAIVDTNGTRLITTDTRWAVTNIIDLGGDDLLSRINGVKRDGRYFYLWGIKEERNSVRIAFDRVVRYDIDGKNPTLIYENKRENEPLFRAILGGILDVDIFNEKLYVTVIHANDDDDEGDLKDYDIRVLEMNVAEASAVKPKVKLNFKAKKIVSADYSPEAEMLYYNDFFGNLIKQKDYEQSLVYPYTNVITFISPSQGNILWLSSKDGNAYLNNRLIIDDGYPLYFSYSNKGCSYVDVKKGILHRVRLDDGENKVITNISYSTCFAIMTLIKFISAIYLVLVTLYAIIHWLHTAYANGQTALLKRLGVLFILAIIALFIAFFYSVKFVEREQVALEENIRLYGKFFAESIDRSWITKPDSLQTIDEKITHYNQCNNYYGKLRNLCAENNHYIRIILYKVTGNKIAIVYSTEWTMPFPATANFDRKLDIPKDYMDVNVYASSGKKTYYCLSPVKNDSGEIIGFVEVGQDYLSHKHQIYAVCIEMFMILLTIFVCIAVLISEGKAFLGGLRRWKQAIKAKEENTELNLFRPAIFWYNLAVSFDEVILVLIAKDMLTASGITGDQSLIFMSIPALAVGIGTTFGMMVYPSWARRFTIKRLALTCSALMMVSCVGVVYAVLMNYFISFCIWRFAFSLFNTIVHVILTSIPYRAKSEEKIYELSQSKELTTIAGVILGTLIGGTASQALGNVTMYAINTVACVPVILLLLIMMPQGTYYMQKSQSKGKLNKFIKLSFSIPVISFWLFLMVPIIIISGYKNFLFPIYTAALSLPKMYITTFSILSKALTLLLAGAVINKLKNVDFWRKSVILLMILGFAFLGFWVNTTIVWAVIMLVIVELLRMIIIPARDMLWSRMARAHHLDIIESYNLMSLIENFFLSFKETFLSFFLLLGNNIACVLVGVCCIICAIMFTLLTRRSVFARIEG